MEHKYDIFISYRRKDRHGRTTGTSYARNIQQTLEANGYKGRVFFDHNDLTDEDFEKKILSSIRSARIFILVLTKDAMLRCGNEDDWVRREILEAKRHNLKFLIINIENEFTDSDYPENFPTELDDPVKKQQHRVLYTGEIYEREMKHIIDTYISPHLPPSQTHSKPSTADANEKGIIVSQEDKHNDKSLFMRIFKRIHRVLLSEEALSETYAYKVGGYYEDGEKCGIIISVTDDGLHGIIVNLEEQETQWCSNKETERTLGVSTRATSRDNGTQNTANITEILDWKQHYTAFGDVKFAHGDIIWYLPSIEELNLLTDKATLDAVNSGLIARGAKHIFSPNLREKTYWSSTETPEKDTVYTLGFLATGRHIEFLGDQDLDIGFMGDCDGEKPKNSVAYARTFARF